MVSKLLVKILAYSGALAMAFMGVGVWIVYVFADKVNLNAFELIESFYYM